MKKIIITGATSMLGTALSEIAIREGVEVYAFVRPNTERIDRVIKSDFYHVLYATLDDLNSIDVIPSDCDVLYHFAWVGTSREMRDDPEIQEQNIQYTLDAVKLAKKAGCRRFVGAGSQAEYGPMYEKIDENTKFSPVSSYGMAKLAAGVLSRKLCEKNGIEHVWGRIFSVYGPHDNDGTMLRYAIDSWNDGKTARFSSGKQSWNYLYESDAGEMFYRLGCEDVPSGEYFVANPKSCSLREYINVLMLMYGKELKAKFSDDDSELLPGLDVDMNRTLQILKYEPQVTFEDGIREMIGKNDE